MDIKALVVIPGRPKGRRIGIVRFYESGYYTTALDRVYWTDEQVKEYVRTVNLARGISQEVEKSALEASMFGWHCPCASPAIEYFKSQSLKVT